MRQHYAVPAVMATWVVIVGLSLVAIILFGPYTHGNMAQQVDPGYTRTDQAVVGVTAPFAGAGLAGPLSTTDEIARGRALMVANDCAGCHGLDGRGGVIGKPIIGFTAAELRTKTSKGPGEMPAFAQGKLTDSDLEAIAAYLTSLKSTAH